MHRKISVLATMLLVLLLVAFVPVPGGAWYIPSATPTDDLQYERFGPQVDTVAIPVYGTQEAEYLAFKAKDIDLMDWQLLPSQHDEMNTIDPDMAEYARPFCAKFDMFQIDMNNAREPTSDVYFRRALAHCIDKDDFIATELAGMGHKMETPLGYLEGTAWYNTEVTTYPYGLSDAAAILDAHGYTDTNADGWREYPNAAGTAGSGTNINLIFYARADDPQRSALGTYFTEKLEVALKTATGAGIDVTLNIAPKSTCEAAVRGTSPNWHMYTGHWVMGRDPDSLYSLYHSDFDWGPWSRNYVHYPGFRQPITNMNFTSNAAGWSSSHTSNGSAPITWKEVTWSPFLGNPWGSAGGSAIGQALETSIDKDLGTVFYNFSYTFTAPTNSWTSATASFAWCSQAAWQYSNNKLEAVKLLLTDSADVVLEELYVDDNNGLGWTGQDKVGYYYRAGIPVSASMTAGNNYKLKVQFIDTDTVNEDDPLVTFRIDDVGITFMIFSEFNAACEDMLYASEIGDKDTPSTAVYHAWEMQEIFSDDAPMIPVWNSAGYGGFLTGWEGIVNGVGAGPNSWWTFLNAHKTGTNTLRYGFMNDIEALNVVHSQGIWDWHILDEIYDTLIRYNPYNVGEDFGWMAERWEVGTWSMAGETCTKLTFHLRKDNYWTDLEPHPGGPRKYLGTQTFYDMPVTAQDVAFTIEYIRDNAEAWNNWRVADVDHIVVVDDYTVEAYYGVYLPLWADHWVGGLPIMPKHIWEPVPNWDKDGSGVIDTREYDPIANRTLVGSGPFTFDYDAMIAHEYYELDVNTRYLNYHSVRVGIQTSTATGTPQIYVMNFKNELVTVPQIDITEDETVIDSFYGVTVEAADKGKPGMVALTSSALAAKPPGIYGPIKAEIIGGHAYTEGTVALNTNKGDVDGDFTVMLSDAVTFIVFYGWNPSPFGNMFLNGDITGDCRYNVLDAIQIQMNIGPLAGGIIDPSAKARIAAPIIIDEAAAPGAAVSIDITVSDVTDLLGFDFKLDFDPVILTASDVTVGDFLPDNCIWLKEVGADYVRFMVTRFYFATPGISGSGVLATVHFTFTGIKGVSPLDLHNTALADSSGQPIPHAITDGAYSSTTDITVNLLTTLVEARHWKLSKDPEGYVTLSGKIKNKGSGTTQAKVVFNIYDALGGWVDQINTTTVHMALGEIRTLPADFYAADYVPEEFTVEAQVFYLDTSGVMVGGLQGGHRETMTVFFFAVP